MPDRRKEAIPLFWVLSFYGENNRSGQDLGTRIRSSEAKKEWSSRNTKEVLGGEGGNCGKPRRVGVIHRRISMTSVWDNTISKCRRAGGSSSDRCLSCLSP